MTRFIAISAALAALAAPALAHPDHLGDAGFGHSHYLDTALIAGAALAAAGWGLAGLWRRLVASAQS